MKDQISLFFSELASPVLDRTKLEAVDPDGIERRAVSIRDGLAHPEVASFHWARGIKVFCLALVRLRLCRGQPKGCLLLSGYASSAAATLDNLVHKADGMVWLGAMLSTRESPRDRILRWFVRQNSQFNNKHGPVRVFAGRGADALASEDVQILIAGAPASDAELKELEAKLARELGEPAWSESDSEKVGSLPATSSLFAGREEELGRLDGALDEGCRIFQIVGPGGRGKTALARKWTDELAGRAPGEFRRIVRWSFYRQGFTSHSVQPLWAFRQALAQAFHIVLPAAASATEMANLLFEGFMRKPTVLLLDGMEALLHGQGEQAGRLRDDVLPLLLRSISSAESGFCLLTSRMLVANLKEMPAVQQQTLAPLSREDTRKLLRMYGVTGLPQDLEAAVEFTEGHPLLIRLLASRLARRETDAHLELGRLLQELREVSHWRDRWTEGDTGMKRMLRSYARQLAGTPELALLHLSAVFDRTPDEGAMLVLLTKLRALGGSLLGWESLSLERWQEAAENLRRYGLAHEDAEEGSLVLEMHPLINGFFSSEFQRKDRQAYRTANRLLYEHFCAAPEKRLPDTLEEMEPLFRAIYHGCQGGLHQRAFDEVAWERLSRRYDAYILTELGAYQEVLALMSCFCKGEWSFPADSDLSANNKGMVLQAVSHAKRVEEKLDEAIDLMRRSANWLAKGGDLLLFSTACFHTVRMATARGRLRLGLLMCARLQFMGMRHPKFLKRTPDTPLERDLGAFGLSNLAYFLLITGRRKESAALLEKALSLVRVDYPALKMLPGLAAPFHAHCLIETGQNALLLEAIEAGELEFNIRKYEFNNSAALAKGRAWTEQAIQADRQPDFAHRAKTIAVLDEAVQQAQNFGRWLLLADALLARARWLAHFGSEDELGAI
jgi:tetratricopeptide (TPR) repeat protein